MNVDNKWCIIFTGHIPRTKVTPLICNPNTNVILIELAKNQGQRKHSLQFQPLFHETEQKCNATGKIYPFDWPPEQTPHYTISPHQNSVKNKIEIRPSVARSSFPKSPIVFHCLLCYLIPLYRSCTLYSPIPCRMTINLAPNYFNPESVWF